MEDRTYTQKELYQFVTEYSKEAREEGFDMSVGDFVDWVASREESSDDIIDCDRGAWACANCGFFNSHSPNCTKPLRAYLRKSTTPIKDKPVLPEKLEVPLFMGAKDTEDIEIIQFLMRVIAKQNEILDYLKEKNL